jgi:hypothetical protein
MENLADVMRTALRVMTAICDYRDPIPQDLDELKLYAPELAHLSPEQLAHAVIGAIVEKSRSSKAMPD